MGLGLVDSAQQRKVSFPRCNPYTRTIGRKRVSIPRAGDELPFSTPLSTPSRKQHKRMPPRSTSPSNRLELLPQEILIHVLCMVNRSNLKELIFVSKTVHDAVLIAKESHFDVSTPISKPASGGPAHSDEAPNAPRRASRSRQTRKDLGSITVALFTSPEEKSA
ncbi:unnamed protein product [Spirodela intermedia]|uniref:F-box domain-containing protein n=1 Tax=Spirodela intermedia TaxID=51605 RepID=A0A7I8K503_SPIIN|nr:unnamed protein product [Spirodela intermedia]